MGLITRIAFAVYGIALGTFSAPSMSQSIAATTIYYGGDILTMEGDVPVYAEAVAIRDDRIVLVGSRAETHRLEGPDTKLVDIKGRTLMPGFVDSHLHPVQGATMLMPRYVTPFDWKFPWGDAKAIRGSEAFFAKVTDYERAVTDPTEPLIVWGYLEPYHDRLNRSILDKISTSRPIIVWSFSAHEMYFNTAALNEYGLTAEQAKGNDQIDYEEGFYRESGLLQVAVPKIIHLLQTPEKINIGLQRLAQLVPLGGITTVGDMGTGSAGNIMADFNYNKVNLDTDTTPFRVRLVPDVKTLRLKTPDETELAATVEGLATLNTRRMLWGKQVKLYADGAFFGEAMQLEPPGYKDGHEGEWMMPPGDLQKAIAFWWSRDYDIHIHCNGSMALTAILDEVERLLAVEPRRGQRLIIEHFGVSTAGQVERAAKLGVNVSANPIYLYDLADYYTKGNLGPEAGPEIVRLGDLYRNNVRFALHTDFPMAPLEPLRLAWVAVNRVTAEGTEMAPHQKVPVYTALQSITINGAYMLRLEDEVGSIKAGKKADFVILNENPMKVNPMKIKDIEIFGTVFEGESFPVK